MISFACPSCDKKLSVKDAFAGKRGTCPHCKKPVLVPAPEADATRAIASERPAAASPAPRLEAMSAALEDTPPGVGAAKVDFLAPPQKPDELGRLGPYR